MKLPDVNVLLGAVNEESEEHEQARVWLENEEIVFGALHPLKSQVYVRYRDTVILIPAQYLAGVTYSYTHFIDTRLFEETRRLTALKLPSFTLTLQDGMWRQQPPNEKLTTDRINDFVAEWQNARGLSADNYSGANAIGQIEIDSTRDGKNEKLVLGTKYVLPPLPTVTHTTNWAAVAARFASATRWMPRAKWVRWSRRVTASTSARRHSASNPLAARCTRQVLSLRCRAGFIRRHWSPGLSPSTRSRK